MKEIYETGKKMIKKGLVYGGIMLGLTTPAFGDGFRNAAETTQNTARINQSRTIFDCVADSFGDKSGFTNTKERSKLLKIGKGKDIFIYTLYPETLDAEFLELHGTLETIIKNNKLYNDIHCNILTPWCKTKPPNDSGALHFADGNFIEGIRTYSDGKVGTLNIDPSIYKNIMKSRRIAIYNKFVNECELSNQVMDLIEKYDFVTLVKDAKVGFKLPDKKIPSDYIVVNDLKRAGNSPIFFIQSDKVRSANYSSSFKDMSITEFKQYTDGIAKHRAWLNKY